MATWTTAVQVRIYFVIFGLFIRWARVGLHDPKSLAISSNTHHEVKHAAAGSVGGTPTDATETVALPKPRIWAEPGVASILDCGV